ncbi:three-helix bundle dimerization domain-containing protein [Streptomyces sp. NPDC093982]|uniref:three-helix bundle dimerization domain-containing protein n=1 Tax=Streptomyces sp. NPDC093982 TaxID=3155077 RepID=UPI0034391BD6
MSDQQREEDSIHAVVMRLIELFRETHSTAEVEAAVAKVHASFSGRPIREFVPVLVERKARAFLTESSRCPTQTATDT